MRIDHRRLKTSVYQRHRPEQTLLYQVVEEHYPAFDEQLAREGRAPPAYVRREFDEFLRCGQLEHGFLRVRCDSCHGERLVAFSCKRRGFLPQLRCQAHGRGGGVAGG